MRPNVVIFLCDQMRRQATSFMGDVNVFTPNLDRCAHEGIYFTNACSTYPICVPFRFTLFTGEYAHSRMIPGLGWRMSPAETTIAHEMNRLGYQTAYFGKWHLYGGHVQLPGYGALKVNRTPVPRAYQGGFEYWRGFELRNDPYDTVYFADDDPAPRHIEGYQTDGLVDLFEHYVLHDRDRRRPFFCVVSVEPPHPPYIAPPEYVTRVRGRELIMPPHVADSSKKRHLREHTINYYAMIENLDANVGLVIRRLEEEQLMENTIFMFLSDHGDLLGAHGLRNKQYPYEESVGIPLVVYSANAQLVAKGQVVSTPTCTEDLYPTLLGLVGSKAGDAKPGFDLSPLMRGEAHEVDRPGVMLQFVAETRPGAPFYDKAWRAFRAERYKYVVLGDEFGGTPWQLFDLANDPYEMHNLIDDPNSRTVLKELHGLLYERLMETQDDYALKPAFGYAGLNYWEYAR